VQVAREVERLIDEGASLSADDAQALERHLEQRPDDLGARARLLGYQQAQARKVYEGMTIRQRVEYAIRTERDNSFLDARARHALWLAVNAPRTPLAAHPILHLHVTEARYVELSAIWRGHVSAEPPDATLLAHAISFFWLSNEPFASELLARAEQRFPEDPRWAAFRRERRAEELNLRFGALRLVVRGISDKREGAAGKRGNEADLAEIERLLPDLDLRSWFVPRLREAASDLALALGHVDRARRHAEEMLVSNAGDASRRHGDAAHDGHLMLGRIALAVGDVARARAHLILAGEVGATGFVRSFGPDLRLAKEMLARGEREVVVRYLMLAREFWNREDLDEWIAQLRAGRIPAKLVG
jgi:hypothetical protein